MKGIQSNGFLPIIAQAIAEMEEIHGEFSSLDEINLAELGRRTGLSRAKLRRLKTNGFCEKAHGLNGQKKEKWSPEIKEEIKASLKETGIWLRLAEDWLDRIWADSFRQCR